MTEESNYAGGKVGFWKATSLLKSRTESTKKDRDHVGILKGRKRMQGNKHRQKVTQQCYGNRQIEFRRLTFEN